MAEAITQSISGKPSDDRPDNYGKSVYQCCDHCGSIATLNATCKRATVFPVKQRMFRTSSFAVVLLFLFLLLSCESAPEEIPENLSKAQMFQRAQEEVDNQNYDLALRYYREFIQRNPDDRGSIVEAQYEIAYIAYKQEDYDVAEERFEALLTQYEADQADSLPEWPEVLAVKLLDKIEEKRFEAQPILIEEATGGQPNDDETTDGRSSSDTEDAGEAGE